MNAMRASASAGPEGRQAPPILDLSDEYDLRIKLVQGSWRAAVEAPSDDYGDEDVDPATDSTDENDYFSEAARRERERALLDALDAPPSDDEG